MPGLRLLHFFREQKCDHSLLRVTPFGRDRLRVRIKRHSNRRVTQQFLHDLQFRTSRSKQRRIRVAPIYHA
jgi:hypothetical protein